MFGWWGRAVVRLRWPVLTIGLAVLVLGALWGTGVFGHLTGGGFTDPEAESSVVQERLAGALPDEETDLIVLFSVPAGTVDDPAVARPVTDTLRELREHPNVRNVVSWYDTQAPALLSEDRRSTYAAVTLVGETEDELLDAYREVEPLLATPEVTTRAGGLVAFLQQSNEQTERDIIRAELITFPLLLVLLVFIFRGLVAALTPLLIGALAILGAFVATRLLTIVSDVSVFAINIITVIGLGMAIDYALFVVNRFREELASERGIETAVVRTLATAGRAVLVSGITTMLALASMLIFPHVFLRSMAFGGIAAIGVAMLSALTVLPALLAVLGRRVNAGRMPVPRLPWSSRQRAGSPAAPPPAGDGPDGVAADHRTAVGVAGAGAWSRLADSVMRRPVLYLGAALAVMAVLASPGFRVEFGGFDERVLPDGADARVVADQLEQQFPAAEGEPVQVLLAGASPAQAQQFLSQVAALPDVTDAEVAGMGDEFVLLHAGYPGDATGEQAWSAVRDIRALPEPAGVEVLVGGRTAVDLDLVDDLQAGLPWMLLLMAGAIMLVLFLAFGSVTLPVLTVLMNLVSIGAAVGVVVWGFQDGNLAWLLDFTVTGVVHPAMLLLMLAVLFGVSTDYQVFLLSRMREEWDRTGDNRFAVAYGLQRTGRIVTAAALLLIVVVGSFATGDMDFVALIGMGMIVALAADATVVRALLVPASMRLLGRANWWAPGPLGAVYRRFGIRDMQ